MAKHLARIHGTEEDKVNCPFYYKIGACRHADRCSRLHHKPAFSPTLLIKVRFLGTCSFPFHESPLLSTCSTCIGTHNVWPSCNRRPQRAKPLSTKKRPRRTFSACLRICTWNFQSLERLIPCMCVTTWVSSYLTFGIFGWCSKPNTHLHTYFLVRRAGDHMIGHVYCKFFNEEDAADALQVMNGRYYDGRKMEWMGRRAI